SDFKKKCIIASIPFFRNIAEYCGDNDTYIGLTSFLHYKTKTAQLRVSDLLPLLNLYQKNEIQVSSDENYLEMLDDLSQKVLDEDDDISLENKLVLSINSRLKVEKLMKERILNNEKECPDAEVNQTREWFIKAKPYLKEYERNLIDEVNLITPESIHLNAFMYEPLIDVSIWKLKDLFNKVYNLQNLGI
ncbi:MAG: hypothetical protein PUH01_06865, partial [Pseudomonadota bacterium]|nr:hypothetical protein [Pseudomonadota bacterium]